MTYQESVVAQARLWIGFHEDSANPTVFSAGLDRPAEAWCQDFVQFVSASAGFKQPYPTPGVVAIGHWAQQHGIWIASTKATPGCQICYDWKNGDGREPVDPFDTHTGLYIGGGHTIEGNTGSPPRGVLQNSVALGAANIWGAIDWPRYWDSRPQPPDAVSRFPRYPAIQQGSKGDIVKAFQRGINIVLGSGLDVDGEFGPKTQAACQHFQKICQIPANGVCGQQTWASLDVALDKLKG